MAPYEADAQLGWLSKAGLIDAVISEDSDCIPYGCADPVFKLDKGSATGQRVHQEALQSTHIRGFDLRGMSEQAVVAMCVFSGCDYLPSVPGMGIKKAHKLMTRFRSADKALRSLRWEGQLPLQVAVLPPGVTATLNHTQINGGKALARPAPLLQYEVSFYKAMITFAHQVSSRGTVPHRHFCCHLLPLVASTFLFLFPVHRTLHTPFPTHSLPSNPLNSTETKNSVKDGLRHGAALHNPIAPFASQ